MKPTNGVFSRAEKGLSNSAAVSARHQWLTCVILVTQEGEIRRIQVQIQPQANQIVPENRAGGVA
jgi:hypothetical protein